MGNGNVQQSVPASFPFQPQVHGNELNVLPEDIIRSFGVTTTETNRAGKAVEPTPAVGTHISKLPSPADGKGYEVSYSSSYQLYT